MLYPSSSKRRSISANCAHTKESYRIWLEEDKSLPFPLPASRWVNASLLPLPSFDICCLILHGLGSIRRHRRRLQARVAFLSDFPWLKHVFIYYKYCLFKLCCHSLSTALVVWCQSLENWTRRHYSSNTHF